MPEEIENKDNVAPNEGKSLDVTQVDGEGQPNAALPGPSLDVEVDVMAELESALDSIPEEQKAFLAPYMTPEFAEIMKILLGEEVGRFFQEVSNPDIILVPLKRSNVEAELGAMRADEQLSSVSQQPPASQQGVPSGSVPSAAPAATVNAGAASASPAGTGVTT